LAPHEGRDYALFLNHHGVTCFVLKYRLGSGGYRHPVMLNDAQRAIRLVRAGAAEQGLDPKRIGIMGSSAGGHLASTAVTHFDDGRADAEDPVERVSSRPDLGVLCYAVITLGQFTHQGSKTSLLGENPRPELVELLSNEKQVTVKTPPCFLWHTTEDTAVPAQNSLMFADALQRHGVRYALHIYPKGGHGLGLGLRDYQAAEGDSDRLLPWTRELVLWLREHRFAR
jgi:acetyl esterase/lipase